MVMGRLVRVIQYISSLLAAYQHALDRSQEGQSSIQALSSNRFYTLIFLLFNYARDDDQSLDRLALRWRHEHRTTLCHETNWPDLFC